MGKKSKKGNNSGRAFEALRRAMNAPVTAEENIPRYETRQEFYSSYAAEQKAEHDRRAAAEKAARSATILTQASPEMDECPQFVRGTMTRDQFLNAASKAFEVFRAGLKDVTLNEGAEKKLGQFTAVNPTADWTRAEVWQRAYELLKAYSFDSVDLTDLSESVTQPEPTVAQPAQSFDDLDNQSARDRVLSDVQFSAKQVFDNWKASIARDFHGYCPTQSEVKYITDFLTARNLPYQKETSWHAARLSAIRAGMFNSAIRYAHEILAEKIESTTELSPMEERRAINAELYRLQQQ